MGRSERTPAEPFADPRAEAAVLGAVLLDNGVLPELRDVLRPEHFYREPHRHIWRSMGELHAAGSPIDTVTLSERLRESSALKAAGGASYLVQLSDETPAALNAWHYAEIVRTSAAARALRAVCLRVIEEVGALDSRDHGAEWAERTQREVLDALAPLLASRGQAPQGEQTLAQVAGQLLLAMAAPRDGTGPAGPSIPAPWPDLRCEVPVGTMTVVGAWPGIGKSALLIQWWDHYARLGLRPHYACLEDGPQDLVLRLAAQHADLDAAEVRRLVYGQTSGADAQDSDRLAHALALLAGREDATVDARPRTVEQLRMQARTLHRAGCRMLLVDHGLRIQQSRGQERRERIEHICRELAELAKELRIPVVVAVQLVKPEKQVRYPTKADLRETGQWEQDARLILLLHREGDSGRIEVAKATHGPTGAYATGWQGSRCRWLMGGVARPGNGAWADAATAWEP